MPCRDIVKHGCVEMYSFMAEDAIQFAFVCSLDRNVRQLAGSDRSHTDATN